MAVLEVIKMPGVTVAQYDEVRRLTAFETDQPKGAVFHVCASDDSGLRIADVWESEADFNNFLEQKLAGAMDKAGVMSPPEVEMFPVHNIFQPG